MMLHERGNEALNVLTRDGLKVLRQDDRGLAQDDKDANQAYLPAHLVQQAGVTVPKNELLVVLTDIRASREARLSGLVLSGEVVQVKSH
jgi:hypothetical protein